MKNIMKRSFAFLLSFSLIHSAVPLAILAEEAEAEAVQEEIITEPSEAPAESDVIIEAEPETEGEPADTEHIEDSDAEPVPARPLPSDADINAGIKAEYASDQVIFVLPNQSARCAVSASSGADGIKYQWYVQDGNFYKIVSGETRSYFSVDSVKHNYDLQCVITDAANNKTDLSFHISVINSLNVTYADGYEVLTGYGKSAKLEAKVTADDMYGMSYEWWEMSRGTLSTGSPVCTVSNVTEKMTVYMFLEDRYGNNASFAFRTGVQNHLKAKFAGERFFVYEGDGIPLTPMVKADDKSQMQYTWFYNELDENGNVISSISPDNATDTLVLMDLHHDVDVSCRVTDRYKNDVYCETKILVVPSGGVKFLYDKQFVEVNADDMLAYRNDGGKMTWFSSNENVLPINDGKYTPWVSGIATITGRNAQGREDRCKFIVMFDDVIDLERYYFDPVYWAFENQITTGTKPRLFSPDAKCTREQIVTFLWRLNNCPEPKKNITFTDVKKSDYFYKAVSWAAEKGITVGLNDGTGRFGVGHACTREQCVTFLWRAAGCPETTSHGPFKDNLNSQKYYYDAIGWASSYNITKGVSVSSFGVGTTCTRAMIVTFLNRYANPIYY